jgi:hypothetical protein
MCMQLHGLGQFPQKGEDGEESIAARASDIDVL